MRPTVFSMGQGPRLVAGLRRRDMVAVDSSAFSELQKPAVDPGPSVPSELPVRHIADITKGLGLSYEAERDLTRALEQWMGASDPVQFRGRLVRGMLGFAPDNLALRSEVWRRAAGLYRSRNPMQRRRPGSIVVQKAQDRTEINKWKVGQWLRLNPNPTDAQVHDFAREVGMPHAELEAVIYELATDHAQQHMGKGEVIPGGRAAGMNPDDFDSEQLAVGAHHEMEHTASNRALAMEIAMDHLAEDADYYRKLKQMEKGADDDWAPMPGVAGGLRRPVQGGYEYRFPAADLSPQPEPQLARVLSTPPVPQPPELLFCYPSDEPFEKGAQHKYIKRVPTGKVRPKYRYIYKLPKRKGLVVDEHLVAGSKFKVNHAGKLGHFEVLGHNEKKGLVQLKHDESGRTAWIKRKDLSRMLEAHHARAGRAAAADAPAKEKDVPASLERAQMGDLARGEWTEVVGFEPTEQAAAELAAGLKAGWDYAAVEQPNGFMVVARQKSEGASDAADRQGADVKVHLRNEAPVNASYALMEADEVIASHDPVNFNVRRDYPAGVQEREYHRSKHEQGKVIRIAQKMEPVFLINNNPDGINGTPIVTPDGEVLGGNARTLGIQRAYKKEPGSAEKYKNHLVAHASDYGLSPAAVRGMKNPVLVRRAEVDKGAFSEDGKLDKTRYSAHLRLLGRRMNEGMTQGLDPRAEEVALGKNFVDDRMLRALTDRVEEGESLDKFLQSERSRPFVKSLWASGIIDDQNAGQFTYSDEAGSDEGLLNKEGRARLERVLVGRLIDSPTLLDRMGPTQRQALANSVVHIVVAQQSGWDIVPQLKRAVQIDQSIQRMEKDLGAEGKPRLALKRFLEGRQQELPGVSGMADEVRRNDMLRHLVVIVREKAGTRTMPRDFLGFALRAKEDAQKNPELTGQSDMFGGAFAAKREDPARALDIEFGVSPLQAKTKKEREQAARAEVKRQEQERKRIAEEKKQVGQGSILAASLGMEPPDLIKASEPNRLVTRAIHHVEMLVDAAVSTSMLEHGEIRVDGARITKRVLADLDAAMRKDPELAREQGRSPVDAKVVRGLIEAFCQMRGKSLMERT